MNTEQVLREAADHIEQVGWIQGQMFPIEYDDLDVPVEKLPCCGLGAVAVVTKLYVGPSAPDKRSEAEQNAAAEAYAEAQRVLERFVVSHNLNQLGFARYNDAHRRTKEQVVATLRAAADELSPTEA